MEADELIQFHDANLNRLCESEEALGCTYQRVSNLSPLPQRVMEIARLNPPLPRTISLGI
jgi:hypothetical protein